MLSVSATWGCTSSTGMVSTSAMCIAATTRVPPMSGEPSTRLTVPSELTLAKAVDGPVLFRQKPVAIPRPRFGPSIGAE